MTDLSVTSSPTTPLHVTWAQKQACLSALVEFPPRDRRTLTHTGIFFRISRNCKGRKNTWVLSCCGVSHAISDSLMRGHQILGGVLPPSTLNVKAEYSSGTFGIHLADHTESET